MKPLARRSFPIVLTTLIVVSIGCGDEATAPRAESAATAPATAATDELNSVAPLPFEASFGGVGIGFRVIDGAIEVSHVADGLPAARAGIEVGDVLVSVDGISTDGLTPSAFLELGRGEPGTMVTYELLDDDGGTATLTIERVPIEQSHLAHRDYIRQQLAFGGVGLKLDERDGVIVIDEVLSGLPAEQAGIRATDRVVSVDGHPIQGQRMIDVIGAIRGEVGSSVTIDLVDESGTTRQVELERAAMVLPDRQHHHRRHRHPHWSQEALIQCAE